MSDERAHLDIEIQDLLEGRLETSVRERVEAHLAACARCRARRDALSETREAARRLPAPPLADGLRSAIDDRLAKETGHPAPSRRSLAAAALALAAVALLLVWLPVRRRELPRSAAPDYDSYRSGALRLERLTNEPRELEGFFARSGLRFPVRVFDLGMMGFRLEGGRLHRIAGRPSALWVYRGPDDGALVCEMYEGRTRDLPSGDERREHDGIAFFVYRDGAKTEVFWQEGRVVCVLVSDLPVEQVVSLAFAKAVKG